MTTATTRQAESTASPRLMMAFELAEAHWMLGFTTGSAQRARRRHSATRPHSISDPSVPNRVTYQTERVSPSVARA